MRKEKAYGVQTDYFDNPTCIGCTREGDDEHLESGLVVLISNAGEAEIRMYIGRKFVGATFIDALRNVNEEVFIDEEGFGVFN